MNERIRELRASAFAYATVSSTDYFEDKKDFNEKFDEKFAELLILECANLNFRSTGFVCSEGEDMVRSMIKDHFGVDK